MKIICVGLNYAQHIGEMSWQRPDEPVIFLKPDSAILRVNNPFFIPDFTQHVDYETEIIVRICRLGKCIDRKFAHRYYDQIGIGIDFTARDVQSKMKAAGLPWELSKAFDNSAAVSEFIPKEEFVDVQNIDFHLDINGQLRQSGNTRDMIFSIDEIISFVSQYFTLKIGDIIFTGTPVGVGKVNINDRLEAYIGTRKMMDFHIK
ncbi:MAG: fumarylacetoacetate hydrolase family protein [Bacteroidales bacterium]|nr:fumarylacetoacetate hydrolase family protein [Bacteroidales bacterium]